MKLIPIFIILLSYSFGSKAQNDTIQKKYRDTNELNYQIEKDKIESLVYIDSVLRFKVLVPEWLTLRETGNEDSISLDSIYCNT